MADPTPNSPPRPPPMGPNRATNGTESRHQWDRNTPPMGPPKVADLVCSTFPQAPGPRPRGWGGPPHPTLWRFGRTVPLVIFVIEDSALLCMGVATPKPPPTDQWTATRSRVRIVTANTIRPHQPTPHRREHPHDHPTPSDH